MWITMLIGELSRRSGVSPRSLRYYEQHGLLTADRGSNGYRGYEEDAVETARNLHLLFALGIDRELVRAVMACSRDVSDKLHRATRDQLDEVRRRMSAQMHDLLTARTALDGLIERFD